LIKPKPPVKPPAPGEKKRPSDVPDVAQLKLAGIVWEQRGFYALVEAPNGRGYVLRVNDRVGEDSRVSRITADTVIFEVRDETPMQKVQTRLVELKLKKEE
jgi:Tfp pilus assembly protein PilP